MNQLRHVCAAIVLGFALSLTLAAQNVRVDVGKGVERIPKVCVDVVPAAIDDKVDIPALVKEAYCKGSGDMLIEYTYVMTGSNRQQDKKGNVKEDTTTYEVFIPTLKSGMHASGILLVTSHNGVPVPPDKLDKERLKTGERIEKEEEKIDRTAPVAAETDSANMKGMAPLGMYTQTNINRGAFGMRRGGASLGVHDFLKTADLTFVRREQKDGREALVFSFVPRPGAQYTENNKYMAQLKGEIWIDVTDRIVTQLIAWPASAPASNSVTAASGNPPAVYIEMMRLREGFWLPHIKRINALDYPTLFDHISDDSTWTFTNYIHFSSEIKDVKVGTTDKP